MTAITPVGVPTNGSDRRPALPQSAVRGSVLTFSADLTAVIALWVSEIAVPNSRRSPHEEACVERQRQA
ncbi:hypothetical protein [Cryobacterium cryoconiti]|uniref:Uncharacterized protein n=1 Tax=Cryobacterium cryoconiti TaxID=1259239 RepID=A0A4Y8K4X6_9MICO|nr:hypothetical protein [Cryobacterium cryoconiti]TFD34128.1 hypothetical protein E3T49_00165 [Cryobacterium cryoconiti]